MGDIGSELPIPPLAPTPESPNFKELKIEHQQDPIAVETGVTAKEKPDTERKKRHERLHGKVNDISEASTISTDAERQKVKSIGKQIGYVEEKSDTLVVNDFGPDLGRLEVQLASYDKTVARIRAHGRLDPEVMKQFRDRFNNRREYYHSYDYVEDPLGEPLKMFLDRGEGIPYAVAVTKLANDLGLEQAALQRVLDIIDRGQQVMANPGLGSNFLYKYSAPYLEIGTSNQGEVTARLGVTLKHDSSMGDDENVISFKGVSVPVDQALDVLDAEITRYAQIADKSKVEIDTVQPAHALKEQVLAKREEDAQRFIDQFKKYAPEFADMGDDRLLALLKAASENRGQNGSTESPDKKVDSLVIELMRSGNALLHVACDASGNFVDSRTVSTWAPQSHLYADGRAGTVTQVDYTASPFSFAAQGKEIGRKVLPISGDAVTDIRKRMIEEKLAPAA